MSPIRVSDYSSHIEAAVADQLSPQQHRELEEALRESSRLREIYLDAMSTHLDLGKLSSEEDMPEWYRTAGPAQPRQTVSWKYALMFLGGALASLVLAVVWNTSHVPIPEVADRNPRATPGVIVSDSAEPVSSGRTAALPAELPGPTITDAVHARFYGEGRSPVPGQKMIAGQEYILLQGLLGLEFQQGARVVLKAPCVFRPAGDALLQLSSGQCSVFAPPGAQGFQVLSPSAEVIDLGTRFLVEVGEMGETDLAVIEGIATIRSVSHSGSEPLVLREGDQAVVEPGTLPRRKPPGDRAPEYLTSLPDRVVRYAATQNAAGQADELIDVTVQRGGSVRHYSRDRLIRSRLTHFEILANKSAFCTHPHTALPVGQERLSLLDEDWSLVTGIINPMLIEPRTAQSEQRPVMSVEFAEPVINGPGPDILIFDLHVLISRPSGDTVRVQTGDPGRTPVLFETTQFDIDLNSPYALDLQVHKTYRSPEVTRNVQDLIDLEFSHGLQVHVNAKCLVLGIDLTDLGYEPGEALQKLDFLPVFDRNGFDPVLIVGLPRE